MDVGSYARWHPRQKKQHWKEESQSGSQTFQDSNSKHALPIERSKAVMHGVMHGDLWAQGHGGQCECRFYVSVSVESDSIFVIAFLFWLLLLPIILLITQSESSDNS